MNPIETFWIWANRSRSYETPSNDDMNYSGFWAVTLAQNEHELNYGYSCAVFERFFLDKPFKNRSFWSKIVSVIV